MSKNDRALIEECPILYRQIRWPMTATCMCWGMETGSGWDELIRDLSIELEDINKHMRAEAMTQRGLLARGTMWFFSLISKRPLDMFCDKIQDYGYRIWGTGRCRTYARRIIHWFSNFIRPFDRPCYVEATQVKEKFGGLRFYTNFCNDQADDFIRKAEDRSEKTCEECGSPGKMRDSGWIKCRCDECHSSHLVALKKLV